MWRPLAKILTWFGELRPVSKPEQVTAAVGTPGARDVADSDGFARFTTAEALHDLWAPPAGSPWAPFHAVTLFAAVERGLSAPFPTGVEAARALAAPLAGTPLDPDAAGAAEAEDAAPDWLAEDTLVIVDLPGPVAVAAATGLVRRGAQPVCTFDNWPHGAGLLKPERVLAQLLHYAVVVEAAKATMTPTAPPVWVCDRDRLDGREPVPTDFDNRYYLDDSLLPGTQYLRAHGVTRVVAVLGVGPDNPTLAADLGAWLGDRAKDGIAILRGVVHGGAVHVEPWEPPAVSPPTTGRRSDAGGFGVLVPVPSSSGSGG